LARSVRSARSSSERLAALARFVQIRQEDLELPQTYASGDLVVLVIIKRQSAEIVGLP
jgi:hypothetical protein